jgi:hypothetical protein
MAWSTIVEYTNSAETYLVIVAIAIRPLGDMLETIIIELTKKTRKPVMLEIFLEDAHFFHPNRH